MDQRWNSFIRWVARSVAMLWAVFWVWFGLASGISEGLSLLGVLVHTVVPGLVFALLVVVAWRWEKWGGGILILVGLVIAVGYPLMVQGRTGFFHILIPDVLLAGPPLLSGVLFRMHSSFSQKVSNGSG